MRPTWRATGQGLATATTPSAERGTASTGKTSSVSPSIPRPPAGCTTKRCPRRPSRPRPSVACAAPSSARCGSARTSASMPRQLPPWYSSSQSGRRTDRPIVAGASCLRPCSCACWFMFSRASRAGESRKLRIAGDLAESLSWLLEYYGCSVDVAHDGHEGLRKAMDGRPDVVFIDIAMPGMTGYDVARAIRSTLPYKVVLIAQTAYGSPDDRALALSCGFDEHLIKPVEPDR